MAKRLIVPVNSEPRELKPPAMPAFVTSSRTFCKDSKPGDLNSAILPLIIPNACAVVFEQSKRSQWGRGRNLAAYGKNQSV